MQTKIQKKRKMKFNLPEGGINKLYLVAMNDEDFLIHHARFHESKTHTFVYFLNTKSYLYRRIQRISIKKEKRTFQNEMHSFTIFK